MQSRQSQIALKNILVKSKVLESALEVALPLNFDEFIQEVPESIIKIDIDKFILNNLSEKVEIILSFDSITDETILKAVLIFLGALNFENTTISLLHSEDDKKSYLGMSENKNYSDYIRDNFDFMLRNFSFSNLRNLQEALSACGLSFDVEQSLLYRELRRKVMENNKILIAFSANNILWLKSEKSTLGSQHYLKRLNNFSLFYYNTTIFGKSNRIGCSS